ncbi:MAG: Protein O-mannosyltransferase 2 [Watsoniomyces obsoletus]|nr:MAG: Protein O-mannosyltransferase 2 [Watsoniomyces obsoletus]
MSQPWDYIAKLVCIGDSGCGKSSLTIRLCEGRFSAQHDVTIGVEFGSCIVPVGGGSTHPTTTAPSTTTPRSTSPTLPIRSITKSSSRPSPTTTTTTKSPSFSNKPPSEQKHMKLSLWDTAGQETYKSVTRSYFRGASGALLVFDLTRRDSFKHVTDWLNDLRQIAEPEIVVVLVGNKLDLVSDDEDYNDDTRQQSISRTTTEGDGEEVQQRKDGVTKRKPKRQVSTPEALEWCHQNDILTYIETSAKEGTNVENAFLELANSIYENIIKGKYDLNDRRSGVKGHGAGAGIRPGGAGDVGRMEARTVSLGGGNGGVGKRGGGCC